MPLSYHCQGTVIVSLSCHGHHVIVVESHVVVSLSRHCHYVTFTMSLLSFTSSLKQAIHQAIYNWSVSTMPVHINKLPCVTACTCVIIVEQLSKLTSPLDILHFNVTAFQQNMLIRLACSTPFFSSQSIVTRCHKLRCTTTTHPLK